VSTTDTHEVAAAAVPLDQLPPAEAQAHARETWRASGGQLSGAQVAARYGRSERWGRQQIAAARTQVSGMPAPEAGTAGRTAGRPTGTPRMPGGTASAASELPAGSAPARQRAAGTRAAPKPRQPSPVPLPLLAVTGAAVVVVTVVCAVVSYCHIRDLATTAGMGSLAGWLPLGVDGLVVAASCSLIVDRQMGRPGHALAWAGVALGLAGSLAANVLAVDPELVSMRAVRWTLAGYGPAALAVSGHLLMRMLSDR
jgi:Protein of unknown function (DUF2637)